ncbi:MlaA family lipoprotein [Sphingomonas oryzagri]
MTPLLLLAAAPLAAASSMPTADVAGASPSESGPMINSSRQTTGLSATPVSHEAEIVVSAPPRPTRADPMERINIKTFSTMQDIDRGVVLPVADGYRKALPTPVRDGLHNFLGNLDEPIIFLNFVAQHKIGKAGETFGRFAINSTLGVAGLFDRARKHPFNLPHRPNGFADTMGFYGIGPGPFMFLPIVGPTTLRDLGGGFVDRLVLPLGIGAPFNQLAFTLPAGIAKGLDHRVRFDGELQIQRQSDQPYVSARDYYLARRQAEIDHLRSKPNPADPVPEG